MRISLSVLAWLIGAGHIWARYAGQRSLAFWLKPIPIVLFMALALLSTSPVSATYRLFVLVGLLFSMAGDIFLALPQDRFVLGLASFLIAHIWYIAAFGSRSGLHFTWWVVAAAIIYGAIMLSLLWPGVASGLRVPVLIYLLVILVMGWQATEQWLALRDASSLLAMAGALLFVLSDSALALNKFRAPFGAADAVVMLTYYAAQWLIALSVEKS